MLSNFRENGLGISYKLDDVMFCVTSKCQYVFLFCQDSQTCGRAWMKLSNTNSKFYKAHQKRFKKLVCVIRSLIYRSLRFFFFETANFQNLFWWKIYGKPTYRLEIPKMLGICLRRPPAVYVSQKRPPTSFLCKSSKSICFIVFHNLLMTFHGFP